MIIKIISDKITSIWLHVLIYLKSMKIEIQYEQQREDFR